MTSCPHPCRGAEPTERARIGSSMPFTPDFIDMDGRLTNPYLAIAVVIAAIAFGT